MIRTATMMTHRLSLLVLFCAIVAPSQTISTVAGSSLTPGFSGDNGAATSADLNVPVAVATDAAGNIYIGDQYNYRIRKVDTNGTITTIAGTGVNGFFGDNGPALQAEFGAISGVFVDVSGNIIVSDVGNQRIRRIDTNGIVTTVAGTGGTGGYGGDGGPATSATFYNCVRAIADASGNIYIADQSNHRVRKVTASTGIITTIAGTGAGTPQNGTFGGDGGPATSAGLNNPTSLALDNAGNLYICDQFNMRVRMVNTSGIINTIAGTGVQGYAGDGGPATSANLYYPGGMVADTSGNIFFSDDSNFRVRVIAPSGIINTVAGDGTQGFGGDGSPATNAHLNGEFGLAIDPSGNLLIADSGNNRIRSVAFVSSVAPQFTSGSVTNSASYAVGGSAGALVTLFGQHLSVGLSGVAKASSVPLTTTLAGTSVTVNGTPAPLLAVVNAGGSEQINFQMPWEVAGQSTIQVTVDNGVASNAPVSASVTAAQPGIFVVDAAPDGAITHLGGALVTASDPAAPGEVVVMYATGFGPVSPAVPDGQAPAGLSYTTLQPLITIGGLPTEVDFSGAAPYFVGLTQLNIAVPGEAPSGPNDLVVNINGVISNTVKIQVQ
jgi:uncharacterized protein (TIGR03437 family)